MAADWQNLLAAVDRNVRDVAFDVVSSVYDKGVVTFSDVLKAGVIVPFIGVANARSTTHASRTIVKGVQQRNDKLETYKWMHIGSVLYVLL